MPKADSNQKLPLPRELRGKVNAAWAALAWERLWPALWPLLAVTGLFLVTALAGLWTGLAGWSRASGLILFAAAAIAALWPLARVRLPVREEALRRLERDSGVPHRPATAWLDDLPQEAVRPGADGTHTTALWQAHRARMERLLAAMRARPPRSDLAFRDHYAVRVALVMALIITAAYAGTAWRERLASPFLFAGAPSNPAIIDAWVSPPAYTGKPPVFLTGGAPRETPAAQRAIQVPAGSLLTVRVQGAAEPDLSVRALAGGEPVLVPGEQPANAQARQFTQELTEPAEIKLAAGGATRTWQFTVVPDAAPKIELVGRPEVALSGTLSLAYRVSDDYGVTGAAAEFTRIEEDEEAGEAGAADPLVEAPDFSLTLPRYRMREGTGETYKDLLSHPWAGGRVRLRLTVRDEVGNVGRSEPLEMTLPARQFQEPLARAIVEQRRILAMTPARRRLVARALDALTIAPAGFIEDMTVYLGLRAAHWRLSYNIDRTKLREVIDLLWELALRVEDGDVSMAARDLRAAQEALEKALAEGASDEEIAKLMDELRQAMDRYLQALAEQMRNMPQDMARPMDPNAQMVRPQDLSRMLDAIENLARQGAREQAQALLNQMRQMMENLRAGRMMQQPSEAQRQMQQALQGLADMIRRQQQLMDQTFQLDRQRLRDQQLGQQGQQGQPGQQGQQGQQGRQGRQGQQPGLGELGRGQAELQAQLQQLLEQLRQLGQGDSGQLGDAARNMGEAARRLGQGRPGEAVPEQGSALDNLRQGAQSLTEQMTQQGQAMGQQLGGQRTDPLGRPLPSRGTDLGSRVKVPDQIDVQTVRQILEELRRRLGEPQRPQLELDYLDRLLKRY